MNRYTSTNQIISLTDATGLTLKLGIIVELNNGDKDDPPPDGVAVSGDVDGTMEGLVVDITVGNLETVSDEDGTYDREGPCEMDGMTVGILLGDFEGRLVGCVGLADGVTLYPQHTAEAGPEIGHEFVGYGPLNTPGGQGVDKQ